VLSYDSWKRFFGGDSTVVGRTVFRGKDRFVIIGVALLYVAWRAAASFDLVATAAALLGFTVIFQGLEVGFVIRGLRGKTS